MKEFKLRKKLLSIPVICAIALCGCGNQSENQDSGTEDTTTAESMETAEEQSTETLTEMAAVETETGAVYTETQEGVTVTLSTDKTSYEEGEEVHYKLVVENNTEDWNISGRKFQYTNSEGLVPVDDDSLPDDLPAIKAGESCTIEGTLIGGEGEKTTASLAGATTTISMRPYVTISYAGNEEMVRCVLNLKMTQQVRQFEADEIENPTTVSVHDPSIFKDTDGKYYIVGTHITSASSDDLFNWTDRTSDFRASLSTETIAKIREWNKDESGEWYGYLWAPDIVYNDIMQKYCIYLSADGDDWKSNIVLLTADSLYGPYEYGGSVVYGGFNADTYTETDVPQVLGTDELPERYITYGVDNKKWGDMFPNCIDPCVFYDEDGELWMSYGSWSGGIFILKLDKTTGLRDYSVTYETELHSDSYFGKLIAGGAYVSGEGSYIQHIGDYYYLFISYGNLEAAGGYNVRVFRSEEPDGGYVDELGNDPYYDTYIFNYNDSCGIRLFGGYKWATMSKAQVAQGHNSAFVDDDGKAYIVFHTRTNDGSEGHYVKIHQLFVNKEGWLVASPYATNGETLNEAGYSAAEAAGEYEIILHELDIDYKNYGVNTVKKITLDENGTVSGSYEGTWSLEQGTPYITLDIGGETYSGVLLESKIEGSNVETMVFTALGKNTQLTLWGSRLTE